MRAAAVVAYVLRGEAYDAAGFRADEIDHLAEVRGIVMRSRLLFVLALAGSALAFFFAGRAAHWKLLVAGGGISLGFAIIVVMVARRAFDALFTVMHTLLFAGQWQFPSGSLLVTLFPQTFFQALIREMLGAIALVGLVCLAAGILVQRTRLCPAEIRRARPYP